MHSPRNGAFSEADLKQRGKVSLTRYSGVKKKGLGLNVRLFHKTTISLVRSPNQHFLLYNMFLVPLGAKPFHFSTVQFIMTSLSAVNKRS